jgi:hypothetical protein
LAVHHVAGERDGSKHMLSAESGPRRRIMPAATLALAGGLVAGSGMAIMQAAGVSAGLLRLQALFLVVSLLLLGLGVFAQGRLSRPGTLLGLCAVLAASLLLPWLAGGGAQARWLALGGFRLHLAPVVLPALLVLLGGLLDHAGFRGQRAALAVLGVAGIALMLQPDPAQLLALTLAAALLWMSARPRGTSAGRHPGRSILVGGVGLGLTLIAWQRAEPLAAVPHVEGILHLAAAQGPWMLAAALLAIVSLLAALLMVQSRGARAAAAYFCTLLALAPLQVTPVPLLGFGAGPLLGWGTMALAVLALKDAGHGRAD